MLLKERLTPCATLLYYWLSNHHATNDLKLQNFQVWSEEFLQGRFDFDEIDRALLRLMQLGVVRIQNDAIVAIPITKECSICLQRLPKRLWKTWKLEERLAVGSFAIASAMLIAMSGFVLTQRPVQSQSVTGGVDQVTDVARADFQIRSID